MRKIGIRIIGHPEFADRELSDNRISRREFSRDSSAYGSDRDCSPLASKPYLKVRLADNCDREGPNNFKLDDHPSTTTQRTENISFVNGIGVAVEKLFLAKFAKMKLRQDAL
jgi:hypothetical protein